MALTWFKVKRQAVLDDPVIGTLSDSAFRRYYQLTALCTELDNDGKLNKTWTEDWLSWRFRVSREQVAADLQELRDAGLLNDLALASFANDQRRKPSDEPSATRDRKRQERKRQAEIPVTPCHATVTPQSRPVTPQEEEVDSDKTDSDKTPTAGVAPPPPPPKRRRKPPTPKPKKPPTPEAVRVFRTNASRYPAKSWYADIAAAVGDDPADLEFWGQVVKSYVGLGWNPTNVKNMLEYYGRREIPTGKTGGKQANEPAGFQGIRDWGAQRGVTMEAQ